MTEFQYGNRVKWRSSEINTSGDYIYSLGTVIDERLPQAHPIMGDFSQCLPQPVAVLWDDPGEAWWEPGEDLELA